MHTFLVRVWVSADESCWDTDLRGVVRNVATGVETPFRNDEEILDLLRRAQPHPPLSSAPHTAVQRRTVLSARVAVTGPGARGDGLASPTGINRRTPARVAQSGRFDSRREIQ